MPIKASPLSRPSVRESMEDIAPAEATLSSQDFLASQRENRKLIFEKLQESQRKAPNSPGKKQADKDFKAAHQRAQENLRTAQQRGRQDVQLAQQRALEDLQTAQRQAQENMQGPDVYLNIVMEHYEKLLQVSSEYIAKLECERNQALIDRDRAIADKEQALANKEQATTERRGGFSSGDLAHERLCPTSQAIGEDVETFETPRSPTESHRLVDGAIRRKERGEVCQTLVSGDTALQSTSIPVLQKEAIPADEGRNHGSEQTTQTTLVLQHHMCPLIASFPLRRFDGVQPQANLMEGHDTRSIVRRVSCDDLHLQKRNERGTEYWFRDVVYGTVCGDTNNANAAAVVCEVVSLFLAGIRFEQMTILAWSEAQVDLIRSELVKLLWRDTQTRKVLPMAVVYLMDFGYCESDVVIADLVVADAATDHGESTIQAGTVRAKEPSEPSKTLADRVRDSANLRIGLTRARYGLVVVGQGSWLTRRPKYNGRSKEEKRDHAELVHDAFRRKIYVRDDY